MARTGTITNPNRNPYPLTKEVVEKYYFEDGLDMQAIADIAKTSRQCLSRWMNYWGIKRRSTSNAARLKCKQKTGRGPNWRGGKWFVEKHQTWMVYAPEHPRANHSGAVGEHVLNAEKKAGRFMRDDECSHHMFMDRHDNDNVVLMTKSDHLILHRVLGEVGINLIKDGHLKLVLDMCPESSRKLIEEVYGNEGN